MKLVSKLALAAALAAPAFVMADDAPATTTPNTGAITFAGGADVVSAYYFRGYLQENRGVIVQPYFGASTTLIDSDDFKMGLSVTTWNSLHSKDTLSDGPGPDMWYENDIYVSLPLTFGKLTVTPTYNLYQYPNGSFNSIQEGAVTVSYDDSDMWNGMKMEGFKLSPYITAAYELSDGNGSENGYAEVGVVPGYNIKAGDWNIPLSFPIALGTGWDGYFTKSNGHNSFFGYISAGITTSIPLPVPAKYGNWAIDGGVYYMNLLANSVEASNHGESNVVWGKVGVTFSY
ncbi:MAG: hypothetical protein ACTHLN_15575 [Tepidisphaeraceae bacterium]